jgi:hypothetical protein
VTTGDDDLIVRRLKRLHLEETDRALTDLADPTAQTSQPRMRTSLPPALLVGGAVLIVGIVASVAFFGGGSRTGSTAGPSASPISSASPMPSVYAMSQQGPFQLEFRLPKDTWTADEAIDGLATLAIVSNSGVDLGGSGGGLIGFGFAQVDGSRHVEPGWRADCGPYRLDPGKPITSPIKKSGGFIADQPDADFYRAFFADPLVHLAPGDWTITAVATFVEGRECSGQSHTMTAGVLIHVLPSPVSIASSPAKEGPDALAADLAAAGGTVSRGSTFAPAPPFWVAAVNLCVERGMVRVYVYPDAQARRAAADQVDPSDPSVVGSAIVDWIGRPRLWQRDRVLVMYLGDHAATEDLLTSVLGPPFARRFGESSTGRPVDTC